MRTVSRSKDIQSWIAKNEDIFIESDSNCPQEKVPGTLATNAIHRAPIKIRD